MSLWLACAVMPPFVATVAYLLLGALYTLPHRFRRLGGEKLQTRSPPFGRSLRRGLLFALVNCAASFVLSLALTPLYRRSGLHLGPLPSVAVIIAELVLFLLVDDMLFYFSHRLLHTPWLYRHVHSWHHRISAPFALTSAIMHPVEWLLISGLVLVVPLALGVHVYVYWACVVLRQWGNVEYHAGVAGPWSLLSRLPGTDGVRHHDRHHARVRGNYAASFWFWDRWLGTELD